MIDYRWKECTGCGKRSYPKLVIDGKIVWEDSCECEAPTVFQANARIEKK